MAARTATEPGTYNEYTVGWVCALPKEQTAATAMLDQRHADLPKPPNDPNTYTLGSLNKHNVVIACLPKGKVGTNPAATVAAWMISTFPFIKFGLMVGIGGGIPPKVRLGDVVVSTPVGQFPGIVQWDFGKAKEGGNFERTGSLNHPPNSVLTGLTKLETEYELTGSKIPEYLEELKEKWPRLAPKYLRSNSLEDVLFKANYSHVSESTDCDAIPDNDDGDDEEASCRSCDRTQVVKRKPRDMRVHYGLIASGNQVIKDATFRDKLNKDLGGHVLCVEMEAAGLMDNFPCIVIRGICDYADSHKNKDWQEHAAAVAAAFAKELLSVLPVQDVEQMPTIKRIENVVNKLYDRQLDQEHQAILDWLTPIDYASQQNDYLARRQPGTGQWLLDSAEYQTWIPTSQQTLFCSGIPGAGKTILTSIVIDHHSTRFQNNADIRIAYVYFNYKQNVDKQNINNLLSSLLKQLGQERLSLPNSVKALHDRHRDEKTRPLIDELSRALQSVAAMYSRVFIIVDALDECQVHDACQARFLSEIFTLQAKTGANLFATSRHTSNIKKEFEGSTLLEIRASAEDVRRYLDGHVLRLPGFVIRSPELQEEIKAAIVKAVDGMLLLAQLHLDSLIGKRAPKAIRAALQRLPTGTEAYDHAYENAMKRIEGQAKDQEELAKQVLSWITCAMRPLTTSELRHALAVEVGQAELDKENLPEIEDMVSVCAGLVTIDGESNVIRLVHYTTQEYFERTQKDWFPNAEESITTSCVTYLSFSALTEALVQQMKSLKSDYDQTGSTNFLESEGKVGASSQALMVDKEGGSQQFPRNMAGVHLAAYFGLEEAVNGVLSSRRDPDLTDSHGRTPLSYAAANGHEAVVRLLLEKGADVEWTGLMWVYETMVWIVLEEDADVDAAKMAELRQLFEKDVDVDAAEERRGRMAPMLAAGKWHEAMVRLLLELLLEKGIDVDDAKEWYGRTALMLAAEKGHEAVVKLLLDTGKVDADSMSNNDRAPLSWAAGNGHEAVVKLLLDTGKIDADLKDSNNGQTPLSWAAKNGHETVVKLLLDTGKVDADSGSNNGRTPLSLAAEYGHEAVVKLLLDTGKVDADSKINNGRTPLSWATEYGHEAVMKLLLDTSKVDVNLKDSNNGQTPLSWAAENGHETVVKLLLDTSKVDADSGSNNGRTPLSWAAEYGHEAVVKLLLDTGKVDADSKSNNGRTPLSCAAGNGHAAAVKLLLDTGKVDADSKDSDNDRTPLSWASSG